MPASDLDRVKKAVESAAGHPIAMEVLKADPNRQSVPTLVRTPRWLQPFEELVTTFGLSSYNELDPTLIVTVSFLIMYGMMFGDLGHGLLLLLTGLWLRHRKLQFGILIAAAGASGMLFGLLYGAAFGQQILPAAWLQPLKGMWTVLHHRRCGRRRAAQHRFRHESDQCLAIPGLAAPVPRKKRTWLGSRFTGRCWAAGLASASGFFRRACCS